jgi:hypothetical protein
LFCAFAIVQIAAAQQLFEKVTLPELSFAGPALC